MEEIRSQGDCESSMAEDIEKTMDKRNMMSIKVDVKAPEDHDFT